MTITRQRVKLPKTFEERLAEEATRFKEAAASYPKGLLASCSYAARGKPKPLRT
jgi:hypothetical protein